MSWVSKAISKFTDAKKDVSPTEGIQRLKEVEEMLLKKSDYLEGKIQTELTTAKKNGTKNKKVALAALKRKKNYEKQLQRTDATLSTVEFQRETLEEAQANVEVFEAIHASSRAMQSIHREVDADGVADLVDSIAEQQDLVKEITDLFTNGLRQADDIDEDDLLAELEEMEQEALTAELSRVISTETESTPNVPQETPDVVPPKKNAIKRKESDEAYFTEWLAS